MEAEKLLTGVCKNSVQAVPEMYMTEQRCAVGVVHSTPRGKPQGKLNAITISDTYFIV